jgi:hypothetical protein
MFLLHRQVTLGTFQEESLNRAKAELANFGADMVDGKEKIAIQGEPILLCTLMPFGLVGLGTSLIGPDFCAYLVKAQA